MTRRKILFLTGTRADFGKLKPLIKEVQDSPHFESFVFATGMHMLARYGSTVHEITKAGCENVYTYINQDAGVNTQMDMVLANTIQGLGHYLRELRPDLVVVHGDRIEAIAGSLAAALNNILVAHVEGGELSGTIDELIRHAVTKMSHLHFVANEEARLRLIQMGELDDSVFVIGSPDIDVMLSQDLPSLSTVREKYDIQFDSYGIVLYHPVTTELEDTQAHAESLVDALLVSGRKFVVIYPNNDAGSDTILRAYKQLDDASHFRIIPSMRFEYFLTLLKNADVMIGNSSAGIREAPVYGVPTINIGSRQTRRYHHTSIVNVGEVTEEITRALDNLPEAVAPSLYFGTGNSAQLFMQHLMNPSVWRTPTQKQFQDVALRLAP